eukprot:5332986-Karenia_brevis.AAC.1
MSRKHMSGTLIALLGLIGLLFVVVHAFVYNGEKCGDHVLPCRASVSTWGEPKEYLAKDVTRQFLAIKSTLYAPLVNEPSSTRLLNFGIGHDTIKHMESVTCVPRLRRIVSQLLTGVPMLLFSRSAIRGPAWYATSVLWLGSVALADSKCQPGGMFEP